MLTPVERVLILKGADLLKDVGPRQLLRLAEVAREIEIARDEVVYDEQDAADALYMVVSGRVRLSSEGAARSEVGPGEAFGTWALVDDSERGHRAECIEDGLALALRRDDFYDLAAVDTRLLQQVVRVMAKRLRELAAERPVREARVEGEGLEKPQALDAGPPPVAPAGAPVPDVARAFAAGAAAISPAGAPQPTDPESLPPPVATGTEGAP